MPSTWADCQRSPAEVDCDDVDGSAVPTRDGSSSADAGTVTDLIADLGPASWSSVTTGADACVPPDVEAAVTANGSTLDYVVSSRPSTLFGRVETFDIPWVFC